MSKDTYSEVSEYFGIEPLEEVIGVTVRRDKCLKRYRLIVQLTSDNAVWLMPDIS